MTLLNNNQCKWPDCGCVPPISNNCKGLKKVNEINKNTIKNAGCGWPNCNCQAPIKDNCASLRNIFKLNEELDIKHKKAAVNFFRESLTQLQKEIMKKEEKSKVLINAGTKGHIDYNK